MGFRYRSNQRFNIEGKVGDKLSIKVQDSEADFDFQNNMIITYDGDDNDIIKEVQAGNINWGTHQLNSSMLVVVKARVYLE